MMERPPPLTRDERNRLLGARGATVWITGLPAAGKTTLARTLERRLLEQGRPAKVLDGNEVREGLTAGLAFSRADRDENVRRTAEAALLLADAGVIAVVALVSPYAQARRAARARHEAAEVPFVEVWIDTPLAECERRDPDHLYDRARRGEIRNMTGVDDPYEAPDAPELRIEPGNVDAAVDQVVALLPAQAQATETAPAAES